MIKKREKIKGRYSVLVGVGHKRRIKTEEKTKVEAFVWGKEFIKFFAALAVLHWTIIIYGMNCTRMI